MFSKKPLLSALWRWDLGSIVICGGGLIVYWWAKNRKGHIKNLQDHENPYESVKLLNEYLAFHYGGSSVNCLFEEMKNGFNFPQRLADICIQYHESSPIIPNRALDIGCAVGCSSFELSKQFAEVIGIDFSHGFIKTCNTLKQIGRLEYEVPTEGHLSSKHEAIIPASLNRENCHFQQGNACDLPLDLGQFGCVLAANLICRLDRPKDFLARLSSLVAPGGICVITSPYTFLEQYTPKEKWLGGYLDENGQEVNAFETIKLALSSQFTLLDTLNEPFLIRETARKHQWTVAHVTIWKRCLK